jgi:hypothetical protein
MPFAFRHALRFDCEPFAVDAPFVVDVEEGEAEVDPPHAARRSDAPTARTRRRSRRLCIDSYDRLQL